MSWVQDAKAEWDKLPGGGKVAVAGIGLLTVGIAGYEWYINRNASATASTQAGVPSTDPNAPGTGVGGLSALDTQSLANMIAGLVNTQGQVGATGAPGAPGSKGPPGPTGSPGSPGTPGTPSPIAVAGRDFALIPFSFFSTGRFPTIPGSNTTNVGSYTYQGIKYSIKPGAQGKVYGINPQGQQILLYEPASFYPGGSNYHGPPLSQTFTGKPIASPLVVGGGPALPSPTIHL